MKFAEVLPHLEAGRVATRSNGVRYKLEGGVLVGMGSTMAYTFRAGDGYLLARDWELVVEEPAPAKPAPKECGSVSPGFGWVCSEAAGHAGRHAQKKDLATMSWPNLPELNATIVEQAATIARLTRERDEARARFVRLHDAVVVAVNVE